MTLDALIADFEEMDAVELLPRVEHQLNRSVSILDTAPTCDDIEWGDFA